MEEREAIARIKETTDYKYSHYTYTDDTGKAFDMAIQALEKQAPKRVVTVKRAKDFIEYVCPVCPHILATEMVGEGRFGAQVAYCSGCGQRLDWEAVENDGKINKQQ